MKYFIHLFESREGEERREIRVMSSAVDKRIVVIWEKEGETVILVLDEGLNLLEKSGLDYFHAHNRNFILGLDCFEKDKPLLCDSSSSSSSIDIKLG